MRRSQCERGPRVRNLNSMLTSNSGNKNALESPLLRLPAELRAMIWKYALRGYISKPRPWKSIPITFTTQTDRFSLLRVFRQIHCETSTLPYQLTVFAFSCIYDYLRNADNPCLRLVENMRIGWVGFDDEPAVFCRRYFPLNRLPAFRTFDVAICDKYLFTSDSRKAQKKDTLRSYFVGKQVTVRYMDNYNDWVSIWRRL